MRLSLDVTIRGGSQGRELNVALLASIAIYLLEQHKQGKNGMRAENKRNTIESVNIWSVYKIRDLKNALPLAM
jgi:hypothetical protein